jgi:voltage-gated potassium channel Kch
MPHPAPKPAHSPHKPNILSLTYQWLFDGQFSEGYQRKLEIGIAWLIIISVMAIVAENIGPIYAGREWAFHVFDVMVVALFTLEYLMRLATAPYDPEFSGKRFPRLRYAFSFYALIDLLAIAPFYFAGFVSADVEMMRALRLLRLMRIFKLSRYVVPAWQEFKTLNKGRGFRYKLFALLEATGHSGRLHVYVDNFIMFWVLLSIVCVVLESVQSVHQHLSAEFFIIDAMAFSIFTLEYIARLYTAPENPKYKKNFSPHFSHFKAGQSIIDLLAILPFLLEHFVSTALDLRFLRVFRLLRLLKLTRYTSAVETLYKVVRREWQVIFASIFVMLLLVVLTASLGFLFEHDAQPDKFENIPQSIYWAVVTLASVGYGDISPITPMGRALTVVLALVGIGIFAIPAGLLASAFTDQLRIDRENFKHKLLHAFEHGELDPKARAMVAQETERLHLSQEDIQRLTREAREAIQEKKKEERRQSSAVVLDPRVHPDLAAYQWRLLVSQLQVLTLAAGPGVIESQMKPEDIDNELHQRILAAINAKGKLSL